MDAKKYMLIFVHKINTKFVIFVLLLCEKIQTVNVWREILSPHEVFAASYL